MNKPHDRIFLACSGTIPRLLIKERNGQQTPIMTVDQQQRLSLALGFVVDGWIVRPRTLERMIRTAQIRLNSR